jgi:uncharacterized protein (TIGR01244 family)
MTLGYGLIAVALLFAAAALYAAFRYRGGNLHTVIPGRLYRSAQPDEAQLRLWHERLGFRTILNLRGSHPDWPLYRAEKSFAEGNGVALVDYPLSSSKPLTETQIEELVAIFREAEGPILVHCQSGADRSSLVSGIFAKTAGRSDLFALWQFSPWYGHWPLPFMRAYAMDRTFAAFRARLRRTNS